MSKKKKKINKEYSETEQKIAIDLKVLKLVEKSKLSSPAEIIESIPAGLWKDPNRGTWFEWYIKAIASTNNKLSKKLSGSLR